MFTLTTVHVVEEFNHTFPSGGLLCSPDKGATEVTELSADVEWSARNSWTQQLWLQQPLHAATPHISILSFTHEANLTPAVLSEERRI